MQSVTTLNLPRFQGKLLKQSADKSVLLQFCTFISTVGCQLSSPAGNGKEVANPGIKTWL